MIGHAEGEFHPGIALVGIADIELPLRISAKADAPRAVVGRLRTVGAVGVALEADFVLIIGDRQIGISLRLALDPKQCAAHDRRLPLGIIRIVRIMAVHAFGMTHRTRTDFRHWIQRGGRALRIVVNA